LDWKLTLHSAHLRAGDGTTITSETIALLKDLQDRDEQEDDDDDVDLAQADGAFDFSKYAAELRVSFRAGAPLEVCWLSLFSKIAL
jgi:hypothetical protein